MDYFLYTANTTRKWVDITIFKNLYNFLPEIVENLSK